MVKGYSEYQQKRILLIGLTILFSFVANAQMAFSEIYKRVGEKGIIYFTEDQKTSFGEYSQNPGKEYWELLMDPNFPLTLIDWKLLPIPGAKDKYIDKKIVGKVKNNSKRNLSEVRIEFTVYDEKEAQIAIVSQNTYDLKPGEIWNFEMLVTQDVEKAKLKGLYVPAKALKGLEGMEE
jgi:hypothetical protein